MGIIGFARDGGLGERQREIDVVRADQRRFRAHRERRGVIEVALERVAQVAARPPVVAQRLARHARPRLER